MFVVWNRDLWHTDSKMAIYEYDPDVIRWGLHHLDVCIPNDSGCPNTVTKYDRDLSEVAYVDEGYCEPMQANVYNDEIIAHAYQEELSRLAAAETSGSSHAEEEHQQISVLSQDWFGSSRRHCNSGMGRAEILLIGQSTLLNYFDETSI